VIFQELYEILIKWLVKS